MNTVQLTWGNTDETILVLTFSNGWTSEDCLKVVEKAYSLIISKPYQVHIILNFGSVRHVPSDWAVLILKSSKYYSVNFGLIVAITQSFFPQQFYSMTRYLYPKDLQIHFVSNCAEAHQLLELHNNDEENVVV